MNSIIPPNVPHFISDANDNGLYTCTEKIDVSGYWDWITLAGVRKGAIPSGSSLEEKIAESYRMASKVCWRLYGMKCFFKCQDVGGDPVVTVYDVATGDDVEFDDQGDILSDDSVVEADIAERLCRHRTWYAGEALGRKTAQDGSAGIYLPWRIAGFYNGLTSLSSNLVGYGIVTQINVAVVDTRIRPDGVRKRVHIRSVERNDPADFGDSNTQSTVNFSGVNFLKNVREYHGPSGFPGDIADITDFIFYENANFV